MSCGSAFPSDSSNNSCVSCVPSSLITILKIDVIHSLIFHRERHLLNMSDVHISSYFVIIVIYSIMPLTINPVSFVLCIVMYYPLLLLFVCYLLLIIVIRGNSEMAKKARGIAEFIMLIQDPRFRKVFVFLADFGKSAENSPSLFTASFPFLALASVESVESLRLVASDFRFFSSSIRFSFIRLLDASNRKIT